MPSIKQNVEFFRKAKEQGLIKSIPSPAPTQMHAPDAPSYPNSPNPALRTTLPASLIQSPDAQRQWHQPAVPQTRLFAATTSSSISNGAAIQSGIAPTITPVPHISTFPPAPASGQFYEINSDGNFMQIYSVNGQVLPS